MYLHEVIQSGAQGSKIVPALLLVVAAILFIFIVSAWTGPAEIPTPGGERVEYGNRIYSASSPGLEKSSYQSVVNNDIFTASRARTAKALAHENIPFSHAQAARAPELTLLGTVILHDGGAALMGLAGHGELYYRAGEEIEGYKVIEIGHDYVLLVGAVGTIEVSLTQVDKNNSNRIRYI